METECEVVVVGGGPAGSTAAAWLARAGRRVVLLERDRFPRFHIGESLLASANDVLDEIGATEAVRRAGFPPKWGATFMTADASVDRYADFGIARGVARPQTWQVPRAAFDELLIRHAAASGADVREGHRVTAVRFSPDGVAISFSATPPRPVPTRFGVCPSGSPVAGESDTLRAQVVIDASGRAALLAHQFGLRVDEPELASVAVFAHYHGVPRAAGRRAGDIRVIARRDAGWFWLIPICEELTSVGAVLPRDVFKPLSRIPPDVLLPRLIADTPAVAGLMQQAERRWPVRVERDFSYGARRYAGDRWILVGDAGSFLDPVFSSGVAIAMESGLEGARAVHAALARGDLSARRFRRFDGRQRQRYRAFRRFVRGFYTPAFRDVFFSPNPPSSIFRSVVTVLAGYWRPSAGTRLGVALFFAVIALQRRIRLFPSHLQRSPSAGT